MTGVGDSPDGLTTNEVGLVLVRALLTAVPGGSAADVLYSGWLEHRRRRLDDVASGLQDEADHATLLAAVEEDPTVLDLWLRAAEAAQRARVRQARIALGRAAARGVTEPAEWDRAELIIDALAELRKPHLELLLRLADMDARARAELSADASQHDVDTATRVEAQEVAGEYPTAVHQTLLRHGLAVAHGMSYTGVAQGAKITELGHRLLDDLRATGSELED